MEARKRFTDTVTIKKLMLEKGFNTANSLAITTGINRTTLGKMLSGKIQPSSDVMFKLVETLDIPALEAGRIFLVITYLIRRQEGGKTLYSARNCRNYLG